MNNFYTNKKVLVTGGAGFIGSYLVEQLVLQGAQVTILDNFSTGSYENIATLKDIVTIISGSITDTAICLQATEKQDIIFHCAALVAVPISFDDPQKCYAINVQGTFNMLEAARRNHVQRFIFSSSAAVYGAQEKPCDETMSCSPLSPYGFSKVMGELLCQQYSCVYKMATLSLRYFNVFGHRQNAQQPHAGIVATLRHKMANNLPITIFGDGLQQRDFIAVDNIVQANLELAALPHHLLNGRAINIATGKSITLQELIKNLCTEFHNYNQPILYRQEREGDIRYSSADCRLYQQLKQQSSF